MNTLNISKIKQVFLVTLLAGTIGVIGCKKGTFDINSPNPNAPAPSTVPPKFTLSAALAQTANLVFGGNGDILNVFMGYWTTSGGYTPSPVYAAYQLTSSTASGNFDDAYLAAGNFQSIINATNTDATQVNYKAVALIMKSFIFQRVVDLYNSVPYSQAFNSTNLAPKYDDAAGVYTDLISKLDTAIGYLKSAGPNALPLDKKYDVLFSGDLSKWQKFANTLKLKMVMRLSKTATGPALAATELAGLTSSNFLGAGEDAGINPGYSAAADNQENPFYLDVNSTASGSGGFNRAYWRACAYSVNFYKRFNDPRLYNLYENKKSGVWGLDLGTLLVASNDSISGVFGTAYAGSPKQSAYILPAFESFFLQAEAAARGYLSGVDAGTAYRAAVEESFNITGTQFGAYSARQSADKFMDSVNKGAKLVDWSAATSADDKLALIITQKWAACNAVDPMEAYGDYRRLGIPANLPVSIAPQNTQTHIPYRLIYPTSELSYNAANVPSGADINTKIFWMP